MAHTTTVLFRSADWLVATFCCDGRCSPRATVQEEAARGYEFAITRRGAWMRHDSHGRQLADATRIMMFNLGAPYGVSHPVAGGDECVFVRCDEGTLAAIAEGLEVRVGAERPMLPASWAVASPAVQHIAARWAVGRDNAAPLAQEEACAEVVESCLLQMRSSHVSERAWSAAGRRRHELALAAEVELARRVTEPVSLRSLAQSLSCSPFHLARVFKRHTGGSIHQRLISLRLAAGLERLRDTQTSISSIAHELGFADHAHFSALFTRRYRTTPSQVRRRLTGLDERGLAPL